MADKNDNAEVENALEEEAPSGSGPEGLTPTAEEAEAAAEVVEAAAAADEPVEVVVPEPEAEAAPEAAVEAEAETEEPEADEEPAGEESEEAEAEAAAAAPAPPAKPKKKRLPRALRPQRTKRKREPAATRKPIVRLEKPEHERGRSQERQGTVVSDAMDKTIVVRVDTISAHRKYKKVVRRSRKFHAHDERNEAKVGDVVRIVETRPLSAMKRWRLTEIVQQAK
jgi:small subunit ribosomal protein S17